MPVNLKSAREQFQKKSAREPPQTAREQVLPASGTVVGNYLI